MGLFYKIFSYYRLYKNFHTMKFKNATDRNNILDKELVKDKAGDIKIKGKSYKIKTNIKNPLTNKFNFVDINSTKAINNLKVKNNTLYGKKSVKVKAPYDILLKKQSRGWNEVNYSRQQQTSLKKMTNTIVNLSKNKKWIKVTLRFIENNNGDSDFNNIFRSFRIRKGKNGLSSEALYDEIIESMFKPAEGSDGVPSNYDIDTTFFRLSYNENIGNSKTTRTDGKSIKTKYFHTISFKSDEGDCLLAIINCKKKFSTIRKDLELPDGGIDIKYIPALEKYLKININIYENNIHIKSITKDTDKANKTLVDYDYILLYESKLKYDETYEILLHENHYSLIKKKIHIFFDPICGDQLENGKDLSRPIKLTKEEIHKSLLKQGRAILDGKKKHIKIENEDYYLFYDIETVFNRSNTNLLDVYSISWYEVSEKYIHNPSNYDLEKNLKETYFLSGVNCMRKFIEWIDENDEGKKYTLIGYNNSRFDNFPLVKSLINADMLNNVLYVNNSLLKVHFSGRHDTFDLCRFTACSLKDACKGFKTYPEKIDGFSHFLPQNEFNKNGWNGLNDWIDENKEKITRYNKIDVLATASLFYSVKDNYFKLTKKNILDFTTLASLSYKCFDETNIIYLDNEKTGDKLAKPVKSYELDNEIRESYTGGRCQRFYQHDYWINNKSRMYDVKSLYPYIMMNRYFPTGDYKFTNTYREDKLGIYNVKILKQPEINIIPNREVMLDWDYSDIIQKRLTSVEIECLKRHGAEFKFLPWNDNIKSIGIYWTEYSKKLFNTFFEPIKAEKTDQDKYSKTKDKKYNPALRNICKLILNSLSGKMGQRNFETESFLCKTTKDEKKYTAKMKDDSISLEFSCGDYRILKGEKLDKHVYKTCTAKPSQLCAFIYAWSRTYMYDLLYSKYKVIYTDTDSALVNKKDGEDFESKFIKQKGKAPHIYYKLTNNNKYIKVLGDDFGQFEEELQIKDNQTSEQYIIGKKLYAIEIKNKDGTIDKDHSKYRMKGVNCKYDPKKFDKDTVRDILITEKQNNELKNYTSEELYEFYKNNQGKELDMMAPFREIEKNDKCYFLTSQLKKEEFNIKQLFTIKKLDINSDD